MTCYFRHLKNILQKAGITVTPQNKQQIDKTIHHIVNTEYKNCSATWQQVKKTHSRKRRNLHHNPKKRVEQPTKTARKQP